ncbi:hypothetical protein MAR_002967 [Mya arenaria]|uniref:Uncharacterized protein n=1 Tax=Mya arenaria TaxID=6604 RepID=A0ABY7G786_MYAAR|nr:hypothetical protein MAR_002967 [Mya arenaria]
MDILSRFIAEESHKSTVQFCGARNRNLAVHPASSRTAMRLIPLCLMFGVIALRPVAATRLSKLEEDVKVLNNFIIKG